MWTSDLQALMRNMGHDPDKIWGEHKLSGHYSSDHFLEECYPDVWIAFKAQLKILKGITIGKRRNDQ